MQKRLDMSLEVKQVVNRASERYPWTHRISFIDPIDQWPVYKWTDNEGIPGVWVGGAFYTTGKYVTITLLKWS